MSSAGILTNRNEPNWPQSRGGLMGKIPFPTNPNPKKQFQFHGDYNNGCQNDESPAMTQTISDNASSINRRSNNEFNLGNTQYVSFNVTSRSRKELTELKNKLMSELEQIRQLKNRIESGELIFRSNHNPSTKKHNSSKKVSGSKRPMPISSNHSKDSYPKRLHSENVDLMKSCGKILSKLMKHKHAWIFNKPVDVVALKLHDYHDIIKHPMDLGTVKSNLTKNLYSSPLEFAAHVRLTFNNAMTYNPKGHDVYIMADQLLARFEELYHPLNVKLVGGLRDDQGYEEDLQASSWDQVEMEKPEWLPSKQDQPPPPRMEKKLEQIRGGPVNSLNPPPLVQSPVRTPSPMRAPPVKAVKQPKPKAKDPNKRGMSMEEKHKLGIGLQSLPSEKMEQVVQIIRKRNGHLKQDGDEIELDIEAVDTETLWELDRLVTNWKKLVSKMNRQALMVNSNNNIASNKGDRELQVSEKIDAPSEPKRPKKGEAGDEDVDIGDDMPVSSFPPVEIEKDEGGGHASSGSSSSSSSSGSDSSSSSDSDTGSSSGSDSDDNAQS